MHTMHWDELWTHATLATMRGGGAAFGLIDDGAIAMQGGRIAFVGSMAELGGRRFSAAQTRDVGGSLVTPGLVDCHTHLVHAGDRSAEIAARLRGESYAQIAARGGGIVSTVRATRAASESELVDCSARRLQALINEGVTTVEIKSGYGLDLDSEMRILSAARSLGRQLGVAVETTFLGAHAVPPEFAGAADDYIEQVCGRQLPAIAAANLADAVDAFCERVAFSPAQTRRVFDAARSLGLRCKLHADQFSDSGGGALAAEYSALSADHLEYLSDESLGAMAAAGTAAVLLPAAFYYLRETRLPPIAAMRDAGVVMAVASDYNPGTAPAASLLLSVNMACLLFGLTAEEALAGATRNAAIALGKGHDRGTLEPGKRADLLLWDLRNPERLVIEVNAHRPVLRRVCPD
jgi:imidazolonepropionase